MSTNASQSNARYSHRASVRAVWVIVALLAVSYAGDEHVVRPFASGQDPSLSAEAPASDPAQAALTEEKPAAEVNSAASEKSLSLEKSLSEVPNAEVPAAGAPAGTLEAIGRQSPGTLASIAPKEDVEKILVQKGTLVLRDTHLADWMMAINATWTVDVIFDPTELEQHKVTGSFTNQTLESILKSILTPKGLGYKKVGNGLSILKQADIGDMNLQQINELITLEYSQPEHIEPTLKVLMSPSGKTQSIPAAKALMVIDLPENVENIKKHIARIEQIAQTNQEKQQAEARRQQEEARAAQQSTTSADGSPTASVEPVNRTVFRPKFVRATDLVEALSMQLQGGPGVAISAIETENALLVSGPRSTLEATAQLMRELDIPRRQVRITVQMYDVSVDALEALGFNWRNAGKDGIAANGTPNSLFDVHSAPMQFGSGSSSSTSSSSTTSGTSTTGSTGTTGTTSATPFGGFITSTTPNIVGSAINLYHVSRHFDISAVIQALDQTQGARLLADPSVTVYNLEESTIEIVSEIPVQQLTQTDAGGSIGTTTFRQAGITLTVLPEIADETQMKLTVAPEFSALQGYQNGQPIIDRRRESTTVMMINGDTLVLGGLRSRSENEIVSGVPGLMNIKYLGNLFRSHRTNITESELIIFIHAEILPTGCSLRPREQIAAQVTNETLDLIPHATHAPFIPPCNDPYCPYHNPRPRMPQDLSGPNDWVEPNGSADAPTGQNGKQNYSVPLHGRAGRDMSAPEQTETLPSPEEFQPQPEQEPQEEPQTSLNERMADPPPVMIDHSAKRQSLQRHENQLVMRRLPSVTDELATPPKGQIPGSGTLAQDDAEKSKSRSDRSKIPVGTNPKARIAQAPGKRPATTPPAAPQAEKKIPLPSTLWR